MRSFASMVMWKKNLTSYNTDHTHITDPACIHHSPEATTSHRHNGAATSVTVYVLLVSHHQPSLPVERWLVLPGSLYLLWDEARESIFGETGTTGQGSGRADVEAGDELTCLSVTGVDARPRPDPVRADAGGSTWVGYTSVTSSMPSSTYMTSCIVSWWYSTISRRNLFSRAYTEFSCASRAFSANSVSNCRRICKEAEDING